MNPVARGGEGTTANIRLRCRVHNQYEAERAFTPEFMAGKRQEARDSAARAKAVANKRNRHHSHAHAAPSRDSGNRLQSWHPE